MPGVPHTFATQQGNVPAQQLDDNFAALIPLGGWAPNILLGTNTSGGNIQGLVATQIYQMLKPSLPWEVSGFMGGAQGGGSWTILRWQSGVSAVIINQGNCIASSGVSASGATSFTIADNGVVIGTVNFAAGSTIGTVTISSSPYTLAQGRVLTIQGPITPDSTLADVNVSLGGTRG